MQLHVKHVNQTASGGSYVVIYEAELELRHSLPIITVEVQSVEPKDADPELVEMACAAIAKGAEQALLPTGHGASIRVQGLFIHPIDFKTTQFTRITAMEIQNLLEKSSSQ